MMRQRNLSHESDHEALLNAVRELRLLACAAQARGNERVQYVMGGSSSDYWHGVQFGYEDAAQRLEQMLTLLTSG
jgi:hypothetical protein